MTVDETARKIISEMDEEVFVGLQTELQYAYKWHEAAVAKTEEYLTYNRNKPDTTIFNASGTHTYSKDRMEEIRNSPLYGLIRERVSEMFDQKIPQDWVGWTGLDSKEDIEKINDTLLQIHSIKFPSGVVSFTSSQKRENKLNKVIEGYGIKGIFTGKEDLMDTFYKHYKPTTE